LRGEEMNMQNDTISLEEKERKLAQFLEAHTTEDLMIKVQTYYPSFRSHSDILHKLSKMELSSSVQNTLILYSLATNKQNRLTHKVLGLANLCKKLNIKSAHAAIMFFKQYYSFHYSFHYA
jgi:replication initiation and membrane attachment protein DnaB